MLLSAPIHPHIYICARAAMPAVPVAPKSTNSSAMAGLIPTPTSFSSMVIVMKVVGVDLIKLFRNFKFEKSAVILTGYMAIAGYFFG